jgi:two-component system, sensor histidine kinase and response regulator
MGCRVREKGGTSTGSRKQRPGSARELKLLLTDLQIAQMDGFEVTAAHRESEWPEAGHLPIIAFTAQAMKGDRARFSAAGMDGCISKGSRSTSR